MGFSAVSNYCPEYWCAQKAWLMDTGPHSWSKDECGGSLEWVNTQTRAFSFKSWCGCYSECFTCNNMGLDVKTWESCLFFIRRSRGISTAMLKSDCPTSLPFPTPESSPSLTCNFGPYITGTIVHCVMVQYSDMVWLHNYTLHRFYSSFHLRISKPSTSISCSVNTLGLSDLPSGSQALGEPRIGTRNPTTATLP